MPSDRLPVRSLGRPLGRPPSPTDVPVRPPCGRKERLFYTMKDAYAAIEQIDPAMVPYVCLPCRAMHIGHPRVSKKAYATWGAAYDAARTYLLTAGQVRVRVYKTPQGWRYSRTDAAPARPPAVLPGLDRQPDSRPLTGVKFRVVTGDGKTYGRL